MRSLSKARLIAFWLLASACSHTAPESATPLVAAATSSKERGWHRAVFYEIFVRSYSDSDDDGVGDFRGLEARLPHLSELGVDAIWLMPIHPSPSYHGYDVTDDRAVNADYGSLADFRALVEAAKARGIRIIIDFVMNHASEQHPWFQEALQTPSSPYREYFVFRDAPDPRWTRPWDGASVWHPALDGAYYGLFWSGMPDWNLSNVKVEAHLIESMRFWLRLGVAGFRVDAARHLFESDDGGLVDQPASHAFMKRVRAALETEFPDALLVAEAWSDTETVASYFGDGDEFHLAFSFDLAGAVKTSVQDGHRADLNQALERSAKAHSDRRFEAPFLANHDMQRVMRTFEGDEEKAKLAVAILMALPGTPFLYYGEEIGMQGGPSSKDEDKRTRFRWTEEALAGEGAEAKGVSVEAQRGRPGSLYETYRALLALRKQQLALGVGEVSTTALDGAGRGTIALRRAAGDERVLFLANLADEPALVSHAADRVAEPLFSLGSVELTAAGAWLGPRSAVFLVEKN